MQGGMVMVGDMFNNSLKSTVDNLCNELSRLIANQPSIFQPTQNQDSAHTAGFFADNSGFQWWPQELGSPSASGSQNNFRYAIFPSIHRLAIDNNGQVTIYDTLDHQIGGIGQQQGAGASVSFSSQYGLIALSSFPVVQGSGFAQQEIQAAPPYETSIHQASSVEEGDIFAKIERLAELRQKGILSDEEFAGKKAELLGRL